MNSRFFSLGLVIGLAAHTGFAAAADLPSTVAPPPPPEVPFSPFTVHGFADLTFKNDYITPRGLLVTNKGSTLQALNGLVLDVYSNPTGFINDVSFTGGTWIDVNPGYQAPNTTAYNEIDYFGGIAVKFDQVWTFSAQFLQFDSPQNAFFVERFTEIGLKYDDSGWNKILPLNPYAKFFYQFKGKSSAVVTGNTDSFDVELGVVPAYDLTPHGLPIVLTAPTWFTVGPSQFWGGSSNFGVFSTGLVATYSLPPVTLGSVKTSWSVHGGVQYYHILNDQLLLAQTLTGTAMPGTHRDVWVPSIGLSMSF
jgi:hypothetical protein